MGTRLMSLLFTEQEHLNSLSLWRGNIMHEADVEGGGEGPYCRPKLPFTTTVPAGFSGGAITSEQWPPRSYSCNFCKREFRTAQGLGGHMNVHRRERAQANQLSILTNYNEGLPPIPTNSWEVMKIDWARGYYNQEVPSKHASSSSPNPSLHGRFHSPDNPEDSIDLELRLGQRSYCITWTSNLSSSLVQMLD